MENNKINPFDPAVVDEVYRIFGNLMLGKNSQYSHEQAVHEVKTELKNTFVYFTNGKHKIGNNWINLKIIAKSTRRPSKSV